MVSNICLFIPVYIHILHWFLDNCEYEKGAFKFATDVSSKPLLAGRKKAFGSNCIEVEFLFLKENVHMQ